MRSQVTIAALQVTSSMEESPVLHAFLLVLLVKQQLLTALRATALLTAAPPLVFGMEITTASHVPQTAPLVRVVGLVLA